MSAHTPGPWRTEASQRLTPEELIEARRINPWAEQRHIVGPKGEAIATIHDGPIGNAALLASAPELFEALRRLLLQIESILAFDASPRRDEDLNQMGASTEGTLAGARAALAKARGRA